MKIMKKITALFLVFVMAFGTVQLAGVSDIDLFGLATKAEAVDLNQSGVFDKQNTSTSCTVCAAAILLRRASLYRGDANWATITEEKLMANSSIWTSVGLAWKFSYTDTANGIATLTVSSGTDSLGNESTFQSNLFSKHPEGVMIFGYGGSKGTHAVVVTDLQSNGYYCADPYYGDRRPLSEALYVNISNARRYWIVTTDLHSHSYDTEQVRQEPTCTVAGYTVKVCSCGAEIAGNTIPALGHEFNYNAGEVVTQPTCTKEGTERFPCIRGDAYDTKPIDALGHEFDYDAGEIVKHPTCTETGTERFPCIRGDKYDYKTLDALGHNYVATPVKWEQCLEEGLDHYQCTRCTSNYDEIVPPHGHDTENIVWVITANATCTTDGAKSGHCGICGAVIDSQTFAATGHDEGVWKVDHEATPEHDGQMSRYCTKCGAILETKTFSMHTHTLGYEATLREATCTEDGLTGKFCSECNACYETESI